MPWTVDSLRVTCFAPIGVEDWRTTGWRAVTDRDPENVVTPVAGVRMEEGPFGSGRLRIDRTARAGLRIDLRYLVAPAEPAPGVRDGTLGTYDDAMALFRPVAGRFLDGVSVVGRMALGVEYVEAAANIDAADAILSQRIDPERFDLTNAQDFVYQINRRRYSALVPGLAINRLGRWSIQTRQLFELDVTTGQPRAAETPEIFASLATDVNTDPQFRPYLPAQELHDVFGELEQHTQQLADNGDRL